MISPQALLQGAFQAALDAADPVTLVPPALPGPPKGRTLVVGGGKAAAAMAKAIEDHWPETAPLSGLVVTRYRHGVPTRRIDVVEASHPLPDGRGAAAAQQMLAAIETLTSDDLLLVVLSGGGSSLLALPDKRLTLKELRAVTRALLVSGAPIQEINTVRKHLTRFSGGRVAALCPAPVIALIISDVVGDEPAHIASGPCAPDPTTFADAWNILHHYGVVAPAAVAHHLQCGMRGELLDTPKAHHHFSSNVQNLVLGSARQSLGAADDWLKRQGLAVTNLGEIEGESQNVARDHAALIKRYLRDTPAEKTLPFALLSGGETTVTLTHSSGRGGRNTEYLLALGLALRELENVWAMACDTDGIDGTEDNAGAQWTPDTVRRADTRGLGAQASLQTHDSYEFFRALGDLVVVGPTRTNVNDFRLILYIP
jgi:glycerate 2-kinase